MLLTSDQLKVSKLEESTTEGVFSFEPLPSGFGHTLGNALRRVLYTSLNGSAITEVKISGASHQFTTIPGVKEDVVEISLNLKKVRIKMHSQNAVIGSISKKGVGDVYASDIVLSSDAEVINKDLKLATLTDKTAKFEAEVVIESGVGYSPVEERETSKVGVILLDALFSPIISVKYSVEPARFEKRVDLDKLTINVQTDGTISPSDALKNSCTSLSSFFAKLSLLEKPVTEEPELLKENEDKISIKNAPVEDLPLQTRTINALKKHGVTSLKQLASMSMEEISDIKNLGEKSVDEIVALLDKEGFNKA